METLMKAKLSKSFPIFFLCITLNLVKIVNAFNGRTHKNCMHLCNNYFILFIYHYMIRIKTSRLIWLCEATPYQLFILVCWEVIWSVLLFTKKDVHTIIWNYINVTFLLKKKKHLDWFVKFRPVVLSLSLTLCSLR